MEARYFIKSLSYECSGQRIRNRSLGEPAYTPFIQALAAGKKHWEDSNRGGAGPLRANTGISLDRSHLPAGYPVVGPPIDASNPLVAFLQDITEPILVPLWQVIPRIGMIDAVGASVMMPSNKWSLGRRSKCPSTQSI